MKFHHFSMLTDKMRIAFHTQPAKPVASREKIAELVSHLRFDGGGRVVVSASNHEHSVSERLPTTLVYDIKVSGHELNLIEGPAWSESLKLSL